MKRVVNLSNKQFEGILKECILNAINENFNNPYFENYQDFLSFFEETDGTMEYHYMSKEKTNLNIDIYIDDCSSYKRNNHPLWLYFCDGYGHNDKLIPISVSESPQIMVKNCNLNISSIDYQKILSFIINNLSLLKNIADEKIDSIEFLGEL